MMKHLLMSAAAVALLAGCAPKATTAGAPETATATVGAPPAANSDGKYETADGLELSSPDYWGNWGIDLTVEDASVKPGDNFYAIQLKGYREGRSEERYLLSRPGGDFSRTNRLGQVWSASEEFDGQDWKINVLP